MKKIAVIRFNYSGDVHEFLRNHQELSLYDTERKEFLMVETEKSDKPEYREKLLLDLLVNMINYLLHPFAVIKN